MEIQETTQDNVVIITLDGKLDTVTSGPVGDMVQTVLNRGENRLVFDFSGVQYISSAGLRVLIQAAKHMRKINGQVALAGLSPNVKKVVDMAGFTSWFQVHPTAPDAVAALRTA